MQLRTVLRGERIAIRDYRKEDKGFCLAVWLDEENGRYLSDPTKESIDDGYRNALAALEDNPDGYYFIVEADGKKIGTCCAFPDAAGTYDIGYCLHRDYWRQGYGSEMLKLLIAWVSQMGGRRITAEAADANTASVALLRKCGFTEWKKTSFSKYRTGIRFDSHVYALEMPEK